MAQQPPPTAISLTHLDVPIETLHERLADRNANLPLGAFHIQELNEWAALFEPPTPDETSEH